MIALHPRLFVGSERDYKEIVSHQDGWAVIHACKEPYHRQALGYSGRAAPRTHPEYLVAQRGKRLALNMVDSDNPAFFSKDMLLQAIDFLHEHYTEGFHVLVHCNQGESRGPSIALLYLACRLKILPNTSFEVAEQAFRTLYPSYAPRPGIRGHLAAFWQEYRQQWQD